MNKSPNRSSLQMAKSARRAVDQYKSKKEHPPDENK